MSPTFAALADPTRQDLVSRLTTATIEADAEVPPIRITRDLHAAPAQVLRTHADAELYAQWIGPEGLTTRIDHWASAPEAPGLHQHRP